MSWQIRLLHAGAKIYWRIVRPVTIGVRVMLIRDEQVLMVKHTYIPQWYFPGGGMKRGETVETAVRREAREEVGAILGPVHLVGVFTHLDKLKSDHTALFLCSEFELTEVKNDPEIAACEFFSIHDLPADTSSGSRKRIEAYLNGEQGPGFGKW